MDIKITSKKFDLRAGMRTYIKEHLSKLNKYGFKLRAHVILKVEKYLNFAEITVKGKNINFFAEATSEDNIYVAFSKALSKIEVQLKRHSERIKSRNQRERSNTAKEKLIRASMTPAQDSEPQVKVIREKFPPKPMSVEEACLQLGLLDEEFMVFRNSQDERINVVYQRKDGNIGLIEP